MAEQILSPFGFQLETPTEYAARKRSQQAEVFTSGSGLSKLGAVFGALARKGVDKYKGVEDPEAIQAEIGQAVLNEYGTTRDSLLDAGTTAVDAEIMALQGASKQFRESGLPDQAAKIDTQVFQMRLAAEKRDLELDKLRGEIDLSAAKTGESKAKTENVGKGTPGEVERLSEQRESLASKLETVTSPNAKAALERRIAALDGRIEKLNAITGRTPEDVGVSSVPATKGALTDLQKAIMEAQPGIDTLNNVVSNYSPDADLGTVENKLKYELFKKQAALNAISPENAQWMAAANSQQQRIQTVYNATVKVLSGSAVSGHEQVRMDKQEIIESDPPQIKQAKMNATRAYQVAAQKRRIAAAAAGDGGGDIAVINQPVENFMSTAEKKAWNWADTAPAPARNTKPAASMNGEELESEARRLLGGE